MENKLEILKEALDLTDDLIEDSSANHQNPNKTYFKTRLNKDYFGIFTEEDVEFLLSNKYIHQELQGVSCYDIVKSLKNPFEFVDMEHLRDICYHKAKEFFNNLTEDELYDYLDAADIDLIERDPAALEEIIFDLVTRVSGKPAEEMVQWLIDNEIYRDKDDFWFKNNMLINREELAKQYIETYGHDNCVGLFLLPLSETKEVEINGQTYIIAHKSL